MRAALGDLPERDMAAVDEHLTSCAACSAEMADLRAASSVYATSRTPAVEPPPDLASRVLDRISADASVSRKYRPVFPHASWRWLGGSLTLGTAAAGIALVLVARNAAIEPEALLQAPPTPAPALTAPAGSDVARDTQGPSPVLDSGASKAVSADSSRPAAESVAAAPSATAAKPAPGKEMKFGRPAKKRIAPLAGAGRPVRAYSFGLPYAVRERSAEDDRTGRKSSRPEGGSLGWWTTASADGPDRLGTVITEDKPARPSGSRFAGRDLGVLGYAGSGTARGEESPIPAASAPAASPARAGYEEHSLYAGVDRAGDAVYDSAPVSDMASADAGSERGVTPSSERVMRLASVPAAPDPDVRLRAEAVERVYMSPDERAKTILRY